MGVLVGAGEVDRVGSGSPGGNEQAVKRLRDSNSPNLPVRPVIFAMNLTPIERITQTEFSELQDVAA
jgi:hypothetical protein